MREFLKFERNRYIPKQIVVIGKQRVHRKLDPRKRFVPKGNDIFRNEKTASIWWRSAMALSSNGIADTYKERATDITLGNITLGYLSFMTPNVHVIWLVCKYAIYDMIGLRYDWSTRLFINKPFPYCKAMRIYQTCFIFLSLTFVRRGCALGT